MFSYGILLLEMIIGTKTLKRDLKRNPMTGFELDMSMIMIMIIYLFIACILSFNFIHFPFVKLLLLFD